MKKLFLLPLLLALAAVVRANAETPSTLNALAAADADTQRAATGSPIDAKFYSSTVLDGDGQPTGAVIRNANGEVIGTQVSQVEPADIHAPAPALAPAPSQKSGIGSIPGLIPAGVAGVVGASSAMVAANAGLLGGAGLLTAGLFGFGVAALGGFLLANGKTYSGIGVIGGAILGIALAASGVGIFAGAPILAGLALGGVGLVAGFGADMFLGKK